MLLKENLLSSLPLKQFSKAPSTWSDIMETEFPWLLRELEIVGSTVERGRRQVGILKCLSRGFILSYTNSKACLLSSGASLSHLLDTPLLLLARVLTGLLLFL